MLNKFDFLLPLQEQMKAFLVSAVSTRSIKETWGKAETVQRRKSSLCNKNSPLSVVFAKFSRSDFSFYKLCSSPVLFIT